MNTVLESFPTVCHKKTDAALNHCIRFFYIRDNFLKLAHYFFHLHFNGFSAQVADTAFMGMEQPF